jgi:ubiquinone/menaquinone biosynthesis C-methylase UbiE
VGTRRAVYEFWQAEPCGSRYGVAEPGTRQYFDEIEAARYRLEPFIREFAEFEQWQGRRVLEVGVGAGTDFVNFVRAGAIATGVDLTPASIELTRARLEVEGLDAELQIADGEALPLPDGGFELVYSWGVIHHADNPEQVLREIRRVLAPAGEARVMLYGGRSWFALGLWIRHALAAGHLNRSLHDVVATHLESPGTQCYTRPQVEAMVRAAGFGEVTVRGFPTPWDRKVAGPIASAIRLDWFLGIQARAGER